MSYKVTYKRHLAKTISYRFISTTVGFLAMWWATNSIKIGAAFGVVELVYKPLQYYIHERVWYKYIKFGLTEDNKKKKVSPKIENVSIPTSKPREVKNTNKKVLNYSSNR